MEIYIRFTFQNKLIINNVTICQPYWYSNLFWHESNKKIANTTMIRLICNKKWKSISWALLSSGENKLMSLFNARLTYNLYKVKLIKSAAKWNHSPEDQSGGTSKKEGRPKQNSDARNVFFFPNVFFLGGSNAEYINWKSARLDPFMINDGKSSRNLQ